MVRRIGLRRYRFQAVNYVVDDYVYRDWRIGAALEMNLGGRVILGMVVYRDDRGTALEFFLTWLRSVGVKAGC